MLTSSRQYSQLALFILCSLTAFLIPPLFITSFVMFLNFFYHYPFHGTTHLLLSSLPLFILFFSPLAFSFLITTGHLSYHTTGLLSCPCLTHGLPQVLLDTTQLYYYFFHKTPHMVFKRALMVLAASLEFEKGHNPEIVVSKEEEKEEECSRRVDRDLLFLAKIVLL